MKQLKVLGERAWMAWHRTRMEVGQTTAEYALVLLGAAAIAVILITWASGDDNGIKDFFKKIMAKISESID